MPIPEPPDTHGLWSKVKAMGEQVWPPDNEDVAEQLGNDLDAGAVALRAAIAAAEVGAAVAAESGWPDTEGQRYVALIREAGAAGVWPGGGFEELADLMEFMAGQSHAYAQAIEHVKLTTRNEIIINIVLFGLTFALPPVLGDIVRWRFAATIAANLAKMIRTVAGDAGPSGRQRRLATRGYAAGEGRLRRGPRGARDRAGGPVGGEGVRAPRRLRPRVGGEGVRRRWTGSLLATPLNPAVQLATSRMGDVSQLTGWRKAMTEQAQAGTQAFFVNGSTSPLSAHLVDGVAEGLKTGEWKPLKDWQGALDRVWEEGAAAGLMGHGQSPQRHDGLATGRRLGEPPAGHGGTGAARWRGNPDGVERSTRLRLEPAARRRHPGPAAAGCRWRAHRHVAQRSGRRFDRERQ